jgi:hypothetical protein
MTKLILDHKKQFESFNVKLVCIIKEEFNAEEFIEEFWRENTSIYINPDLDLFRVFGNGELRQMDFFNTKIWKSAYISLSEGYKWGGGFFTQNTVLGGTILLSTQGEIVFESLEFIAGDLPDIKGLLDACQGLHDEDCGEEVYNKAFSPDGFLAMGIDFSKVG